MGEWLWPGLSLMQGLAMLVIALTAGAVHGFVGIGFPLIATPLFGLMFGWRMAVALLVLPTLLVTLGPLWAFWGQGNVREAVRRYWPLGAMLPIGLWVGVAALHTVPASVLMLLMAAVLIVYLLLDRMGHTDLPWVRAHPTLLAVPFGLMAGFSEGALNVAGPILLIYFLLLDLPVAAILATMNGLFLAGKSIQAVLMARQGAFDAPVLAAVLPLATLGLAGYAVGFALRRRADPSRYRGWLKVTLALIAVGLVLRVLAGGAR